MGKLSLLVTASDGVQGALQDMSSELQTPVQPRNLTHHTWEGDLQIYLQGHGGTPPNVCLQRDTLVRALRADPMSPERWWDFLHHEEAGQCSPCIGGQHLGLHREDRYVLCHVLIWNMLFAMLTWSCTHKPYA
jgi:hypothetical protein